MYKLQFKLQQEWEKHSGSVWNCLELLACLEMSMGKALGIPICPHGPWVDSQRAIPRSDEEVIEMILQVDRHPRMVLSSEMQKNCGPQIKTRQRSSALW